MFTADDVAALRRALATGALRVRYPDNREVQYRSLAEIREILRMAEIESGTAPARGNTVASF